MAKPKEQDGSGQQSGGHSYRADASKFDTLKVNDSFKGEFIGAKMQTITDRRARVSGATKDLFVIKLRDEHDKVLKIPCATMLMQAWEDVIDAYGSGDQELAISRLRGRQMTINRGPDEKTKDGNQLGTYEIIVWD